MDKEIIEKVKSDRRIPECHPNRTHIARGMCASCYDKWWLSQPGNREKRKRIAIGWQTQHPEKRQEIRRKYLYGVSGDKVREILKTQNGVCAICGEHKGTLHLDHRHRDGMIRGMLCGTCNRGIGAFQDNRILLLKAKTYLHHFDNSSILNGNHQ